MPSTWNRKEPDRRCPDPSSLPTLPRTRAWRHCRAPACAWSSSALGGNARPQPAAGITRDISDAVPEEITVPAAVRVGFTTTGRVRVTQTSTPDPDDRCVHPGDNREIPCRADSAGRRR